MSPGVPQTFEPLDTLLEGQAFRLAYWRVASDEINYRRFFDVNDLASLRMEDDSVFEATHRFCSSSPRTARSAGFGSITPTACTTRRPTSRGCRQRYRELAAQRSGATPDAQPGIYVAIEKISASHEHAARAVAGAWRYRLSVRQ